MSLFRPLKVIQLPIPATAWDAIEKLASLKGMSLQETLIVIFNKGIMSALYHEEIEGVSKTELCVELENHRNKYKE
ncbi:hypothetical protein NIES4102_21520 [Chondrocystis sp. NIES-4102]|nr:hypothetical protein NIES4102_21520 [Chondrocystis sp. NIES-4102]